MTIWLDGNILDGAKAGVAVDDRGLLLGDGLYETLCVMDGRPMRLEAHLARLRRGVQVIGLPLPEIDFAGAMQALLQAKGLAHGSLRLTVTRGSGPRGIAPPKAVAPRLLMTAAPATPPLPPADVVIATRTRRNEYSPLSSIKHTNCLDSIVARLEARERGADDAILLNTRGHVAEACAANVFVVADGCIRTPPIADGALPGVLRAEILTLGGEEARLTPADLVRADELFLTSSLGIRPVRSLDGHAFPAQGAIASSLSRALLGS